jgi:hypothetical protein
MQAWKFKNKMAPIDPTITRSQKLKNPHEENPKTKDKPHFKHNTLCFEL